MLTGFAEARLKPARIGLVHQDRILVRIGRITANNQNASIRINDVITTICRLNTKGRFIGILHSLRIYRFDKRTVPQISECIKVTLGSVKFGGVKANRRSVVTAILAPLLPAKPRTNFSHGEETALR